MINSYVLEHQATEPWLPAPNSGFGSLERLLGKWSLIDWHRAPAVEPLGGRVWCTMLATNDNHDSSPQPCFLTAIVHEASITLGNDF